MQEFLMILKGDGMNHLSPDELQQTMVDYKAWMNRLGDRYVNGQRLEDNGAMMTSADGEVLTDGPFLESKEIIAGFFIVKAENQQEAIKIAQTSPHLGMYRIEVRAIATPKMD